MYRPPRMKFGIFMAPFHRVGENPTLALKRDMQLIEALDALGYDEAWIGEHHSFSRELIADPCLFIAAAAERTRRIRLGTGVISLPYHHPLMVADRMVQLDHMTEGRVMLGCGPGVLTSDAYMMGIPTTDQRRRMHESIDAIMQLLRGETPVNMETDWFVLRDARLQMTSYTYPHLPVAVAGSITPAGPTAAGKFGISLLSLAGASHDTFGRTWDWVEEAAKESGRGVSRDDWRVVIPMHLAETREEAIEDVRKGYSLRAYVGDRKTPAPDVPPLLGGTAGLAGGKFEDAVASEAMVVGTPEDADAAIERILERSGGIGGILFLAHEMANTASTLKSFELFARYVMPKFKGQLAPLYDNRDWVEDNMGKIFSGSGAAFEKAYTDAGKPIPEEIDRSLKAAQGRRQSSGNRP